jgi:predicted RNase H-like HicB family nuclease
MQPQVFTVSVLLRYEGTGWAAQCLEFDIAAQGETIAEAKTALEKTFVTQIAVDLAFGIPALSQVPAAPREYWDLFQRSERLCDRKPFYIPPAFMVRATAEDMRVCA